MNNEKRNPQHDFTDERGNQSTVILENNQGKEIKLEKRNYKIVENIKLDTNKYLNKKTAKRNILTADIGVHSAGFAPIITLSSIIALSIIAILYIMFRF